LASGLLTEQDLDEARRSVRWSGGDEPDTAAPPSDQQIADRLVDMGKLNAWQARQLLEGRSKFNLGPYWIVDSIGQGGMGQVFKAEHGVLGRVVAIKVLPRSRSTPEAVTNFTNEIRALARLDHDKLVRALDAGHDGNVYYLVTEYVPGADLRKLVRRDGPLSMEKAASIIYQVAEGLQHAHSQGLVHRDVKPGNVLVTPEGVAKLSDLGLAGPLEGDAEKDPRFGKIVGTADYISPDHVLAPWDPTPAWDIYSLGCTLYYAVTGKVPFPGGSTADKARAHCELRPLDPRRLNSHLGPEFVDLMADMMAKEPAQRLASAADVMARLEPWLPKAVAAPPPVSALRATRPTVPLAVPPLAPRRVVARPISDAPLAVPPPLPARVPVPLPPPVPGAAFSEMPDAEADSEDSSSQVLQTNGSATAPDIEAWATPEIDELPLAASRRKLPVSVLVPLLISLALSAMAMAVLIWWLVNTLG